MSSGRVEFGGCAFSYKVEGQGDPVVFIQGVGLHGDGWLPQIATLSSQFRCLTFDNRGMAQSQPAGDPITVEQMAADTLAVMDAAKIRSAHLVGHSLGGVIAQQIALTNPDRVISLSLLCTSARGADSMRFSGKLIWLGLRSRIGTREMRRFAFLEIIMTSKYLAYQDRAVLAQNLARVFGHDLADTPPIAMRQLKALQRFDATARLAEVTGIPTLVLSASHDIIFPPKSGQTLAAGIPGARYLEIPDAAHGVTIQCHDAVNTALLQQFASARKPGRANAVL
jgi:pimeloyl-ACP methyl ester carboxylesterase